MTSMPGLEALWEETLGSPEVRIAVLDGPVDLAHPCFDGAKLRRLESLANDEPHVGPATQHGTHVVSLIFGQHGSAVRGIAPGCQGLIVPVFRDGPGGSVAPCSQIDLARAITQAVGAGAHVINISGGELTPSDKPEPQLASALQLCLDEGVLVVAAAGNDSCACLQMPASAPSVLVVGAMDDGGNPLPFSNWGEVYQNKGLLAPGKNIIGAMPGKGTEARSGTSFATSIVSGLIGLFLSLQQQRNQKTDPYLIAATMLDSADGCEAGPASECRQLLSGRLNLVTTRKRLKGDLVKMAENALLPEQAETGAGQTERSNEPPVPPTTRAIAPAASQSPAGAPPSIDGASASLPAAENPSSSGALPAECESCGDATAPGLGYVLGRVGYDFANDSRRDWFGQRMPNPDDPVQLLAYLNDNPEDAAAITWTLAQESTTIYSIHPTGAYVEKTYELLREFLKSHLPPSEGGEGVELVAVPGIVAGKVRLLSGQTVPAIIPDRRGMFNWRITDLAKHVAAGKKPSETQLDALGNFLRRVFFELRNLGTAPQDRAINFAATHAFDLVDPIGNRYKKGMEIDSIETEKGRLCRPGADCWDVLLTFYDPENLNRAREVVRISVDVSDVIPLRVGELREWRVR